ncbi:hypothetical protein GQX74_005595 [Glossina fuscipes]|nr:hypothetical protein GQX74_005595 [Glossina fuscipes]
MLSVDEALISYEPLKKTNTVSEWPLRPEFKRVQITFKEIMAILSSTKDEMSDCHLVLRILPYQLNWIYASFTAIKKPLDVGLFACMSLIYIYVNIGPVMHFKSNLQSLKL